VEGERHVLEYGAPTEFDGNAGSCELHAANLTGVGDGRASAASAGGPLRDPQ
jgi:hypothetical protein